MFLILTIIALVGLGGSVRKDLITRIEILDQELKLSSDRIEANKASICIQIEYISEVEKTQDNKFIEYNRYLDLQREFNNKRSDITNESINLFIEDAVRKYQEQEGN